MEQLLLGIDIGTSACKVTLFRRDGTPVATASQSYETNYPKPGWAEQNPENWWDASCKAIRSLWGQAGINPALVAGVG
ncbi:MAG: FGGY family carbohydrate kinase, partial [Firmicutes bacterium]|nr:FGGY family carbohydrate kinase [Bacillota bacterium]